MGASSLILQALFLGVLQGLTEFLPISSSAHLILIPRFFGWQNSLIDNLTFDVALHAGTLVAILWYFWKDWVDLIRGFFRIVRQRRVVNFQEKLIIYIVLSTIPAAIAGFLLQDMIETSFRNPGIIVFPLTVVSFLMIYAEKRSKRSQPLDKLTLKDSLIIGFAQALALLPGVSRSGITITAGLWRGYQREAATRFSFLLSTPAIAGAAFLQLRHLFYPGMATDWPFFAVGFVSSGIAGYLSIAFLMRYLRQHTLNIFAGYRLILAGVIIFWLFLKG
ncbi:MAG: undecaprenyl-diphosphatase UppP [Deltaproteobacteria bacterium]|nr:undecaprenyl-diphosphatase UppP [Deltaproteobacteria bacterium]